MYMKSMSNIHKILLNSGVKPVPVIVVDVSPLLLALALDVFFCGSFANITDAASKISVTPEGFLLPKVFD